MKKSQRELEMKIVSFLNKGIFTKAIEFRFYLEKGNYIGILEDLNSVADIRKYMKDKNDKVMLIKNKYSNQLYTQADIEISKIPKDDLEIFKFQVITNNSTLCTKYFTLRQFDAITANTKVIE